MSVLSGRSETKPAWNAEIVHDKKYIIKSTPYKECIVAEKRQGSTVDDRQKRKERVTNGDQKDHRRGVPQIRKSRTGIRLRAAYGGAEKDA